MTLHISCCLDETGNNQDSEYLVLAGGVALNHDWNYIEEKWDRVLAYSNVSQFHSKEFNHYQDDFEGWSKFKHDRFGRKLSNIIAQNIPINIGVAVHKKSHKLAKQKQKGRKNLGATSDYGLAFRILRFFLCRYVAEYEDPDAKITFAVEDGPYAAGAAEAYQSIKRAENASYKPALYASMLSGFIALPKGELRGLEVADFIADKAIRSLSHGNFTKKEGPLNLAILADEIFIQEWHDGVIRESEKRQNHKPKFKNPG